MSSPAPFAYKADDALAYVPSRWERHLFATRLGGEVAIATRDAGDAIARGREAGGAGKYQDLVEAAQADARLVAGETFARLYDDPAKVEAPVAWADRLHRLADEVPEWAGLREAVAGDPDFAALATGEVLKAIAGKLAGVVGEQGDDREDAASGDAGSGDGQPGPGAIESRADGALRSAIRKVASKVAKDVAEAREALNGMAPGYGSAPQAHEANDPTRLRLASLVLANPKVIEMIRRAGRLRRLAENAEKRRDPHGVGNVVGLERGADLGRVLPQALAGLAHPTLRLLVAKDLAERSLVQYRVEGKTPQGRGPIVVLVDESGSMSGSGEQWARAAVLACLMQARTEKRTAAVVFFNGHITDAYEVAPDGTATPFRTSGPFASGAPAVRSADFMLALCTRSSGGGTEFSRPFRWAFEYLAIRQPKADLVFVTDGCADGIPADAVAKHKADGGRIYGLTVGGGSTTRAVRDACDVVIDLDVVPAEGLEATLAKVVPVRP